MKNLEDHQRAMLDLLKHRGAPGVDPYLQRVASSPGLAVLRDIALFWRSFHIETQCRFTSRLLTRLGLFDEVVAAYFDASSTSPYVEELSRSFLHWLRTYPDPFVQSVSQFEFAVLMVKSGSPDTFEVVWDRNPDAVLAALGSGAALPGSEDGCRYRLRLGPGVPGGLACTREAQLAPV
jgi:hypothetical protein